MIGMAKIVSCVALISIGKQVNTSTTNDNTISESEADSQVNQFYFNLAVLFALLTGLEFN